MSFDELEMPAMVNRKPQLPIYHCRHLLSDIFDTVQLQSFFGVTVRHGPDNVIRQRRHHSAIQYSIRLLWALARQSYFASRRALQESSTPMLSWSWQSNETEIKLTCASAISAR